MNIDFFAVGIIASVLLYGFALMIKNWSLTAFVGILFIIISVLAIAYPLTTSQIVLAGSTQIQNKTSANITQITTTNIYHGENLPIENDGNANIFIETIFMLLGVIIILQSAVLTRDRGLI